VKAALTAPRCALTDSAITLDASRSTGAGPDAVFTWAVVERPAGSQADLSGAAGSSTSFRPDVAGKYELRVSVTQAGSTASEARASLLAGTPPPFEEIAPSQPGEPRLSVAMLDDTVAAQCLFAGARSHGDVPGGIILNIFIQERPGIGFSSIGRTDASELRVGLDVTELGPGLLRMRFKAIVCEFCADPQRIETTVERLLRVVAPGTPSHEPVSVLPVGARIADVEGTRVILHMLDSDGIRILQSEVRDLLAGTSVILQGTAGMSGHRWDSWGIAGDRVFASNSGDVDCPSSCIYMWDPDGTRSNLSLASTAPPSSSVLHREFTFGPGFLLWRNSRTAAPDSFTLYEMASGRSREISLPGDSAWSTFVGFPRVTLQGDELRAVFYMIQPGRRIYRWDSVSGESVLLFDDESYKYDLLVDDTRLVWRDYSGDYSPLYTAPIGGGPVTRVGLVDFTDVFFLRDGILAWDYVTPLGGWFNEERGVQVLTPAGSVVKIPEAKGLIALVDGHAIVSDEVGVRSWHVATGAGTRLVNSAMGTRIDRLFRAGNNAVVFTIGRSVYYVPL
jgi:hypothetical protein